MEQLFCIGNYSSQGAVCLNFDNGYFKPYCTLSKFSNTSYITKNKNTLYHVVELANNSNYGGGKIVSYNIKDNSCFTFLNSSYSYGNSPCHLTLDNSKNILYVANYGDGSFSSFKINNDGSIGNRLHLEKFEKNISHIHYVALSKDNNFLFVIDLGANKIYAYTIEMKLCSTFSFPLNTQPRHLVFDNKNRIHVITEKSCEIYTLSFQNGKFSFLFKTSLFSNLNNKKENDTGCAIKINENNNYLYASLRGQNLICVFQILDNRLNLVQSISCHGSIPRDISFDKTCKYLFSANQGSNNISTFSICDKTGTLTFENSYSITKPSCIITL